MSASIEVDCKDCELHEVELPVEKVATVIPWLSAFCCSVGTKIPDLKAAYDTYVAQSKAIEDGLKDIEDRGKARVKILDPNQNLSYEDLSKDTELLALQHEFNQLQVDGLKKLMQYDLAFFRSCQRNKNSAHYIEHLIMLGVGKPRMSGITIMMSR